MPPVYGRKARAASNVDKYNVNELTIEELRRHCVAVRKLVEANGYVGVPRIPKEPLDRRLWLVDNFPHDYYVGKIPRGAGAPVKKNRGVTGHRSSQCSESDSRI